MFILKAFLTCEASAALTAVVVDELDAVLGATGVTGVGQTLVDVPFAVLAHKACQADAVVSSHSVYTLAVVETLGFQRDWIDKRVAVVHIDLAVHTWGGKEGQWH